MPHLRISTSSGKYVEELQVPVLATLCRVPRDTVTEQSNESLNLIGAFSIMASENRDIIMPGYEHLSARLPPEH